MGLDMYLGRYHKASLEKTKFNVEETNQLKSWDGDYTSFGNCPGFLKKIAIEIIVTNQYYNMEKISQDFANGEKLTIGGFGGGKIFFRNYKKDIHLDLDSETIHNSYLIDKEETEFIIQGDYKVAYWRKANQIRKWFVNNIEEFDKNDNGEYYKVTKELLKKLIADCQTVLNDPSKAEEILPTSSGFFFGGTEYDEWYFSDLENTISQCERVIEETDWENEVVVYTESW